jgi:hypothetical protein
MINNLCVLFVGDGDKRRPGRFIRQYVRLKGTTGESCGSQKYESLCNML